LNENAKNALNYLATNMDPLIEAEEDDGRQTYIVQTYLYFNLTKDLKQLYIKKTTYFKKPNRNLSILDRRSDIYYIIPLDQLKSENVVQDEVGTVASIKANRMINDNLLKIKLLYNQEFDYVEIFYNSDDGNKVDKVYGGTIDNLSLNFRQDYEKSLEFLSALRAICLYQ